MIAIDSLKLKLGTAGWPRVYDVRGEDEVAKTPRLLPAARRLGQHALLEAVAAEPGAADGPTVSSVAVAASPTRWITRARPKIDRVACPWLIRRFVDARAQFHYVNAAAAFDAARLLEAEPFDIDGARFSHDGERCSFDVFIRAYDIRDEALQRVATIVRGADTARLDLAPEASGLLAMSLGLSAAYLRDEEMLGRAMTLYDALYAWARHAAFERHSWTKS